jgi:hypothetical protein
MASASCVRWISSAARCNFNIRGNGLKVNVLLKGPIAANDTPRRGQLFRSYRANALALFSEYLRASDPTGRRPLCSCCRRAILFVGPAHDDPERIIRQRSLQCLRLIPWRAHPLTNPPRSPTSSPSVRALGQSSASGANALDFLLPFRGARRSGARVLR